jgi:hypothetical protein
VNVVRHVALKTIATIFVAIKSSARGIGVSESFLFGPEFKFGVGNRFAIGAGKHDTSYNVSLSNHCAFRRIFPVGRTDSIIKRGYA